MKTRFLRKNHMICIAQGRYFSNLYRMANPNFFFNRKGAMSAVAFNLIAVYSDNFLIKFYISLNKIYII